MGAQSVHSIVMGPKFAVDFLQIRQIPVPKLERGWKLMSWSKWPVTSRVYVNMFQFYTDKWKKTGKWSKGHTQAPAWDNTHCLIAYSNTHHFVTFCQSVQSDKSTLIVLMSLCRLLLLVKMTFSIRMDWKWVILYSIIQLSCPPGGLEGAVLLYWPPGCFSWPTQYADQLC